MRMERMVRTSILSLWIILTDHRTSSFSSRSAIGGYFGVCEKDGLNGKMIQKEARLEHNVMPLVFPPQMSDRLILISLLPFSNSE